MSGLDKNKLPQERLVQRMAKLLRVQSILILVLTALGIYQLHIKHFLLAAGVLVAAAALALIVFILWKQFQKVKAGTAVYAALPRSDFQMPQIVSIVVVLVVTAFIGLCTAFIIYVVRQYFNTQTGWTICGVTLLAIWLFIAYCWYRIFTEKPRAVLIAVQEQTEGVWPPAPLRPSEDDNKD